MKLSRQSPGRGKEPIFAVRNAQVRVIGSGMLSSPRGGGCDSPRRANRAGLEESPTAEGLGPEWTELFTRILCIWVISACG